MNLNLRTKHTSFRFAKPEDADFIYSLRVDERLNEFISKVQGGVEVQRRWLQEYKLRETLEQEYYFIIMRNDNDQPVGTLRLYGITDDKQFCWGSWVLNENKTRTSALESAFLLYKFAFEVKGLSKSYFQVDKNNIRVISFHEKLGATFLFEDDINFNFEYTYEAFINLKNKFYGSC